MGVLRSSFCVFGLLLALFSLMILLRQNEILQSEHVLRKVKLWSQNDNDIQAIKLLVLAYPRTGSSFTGEILAASENTTYIYEPFYKVTPFGYGVDNVGTWNTSVQSFVKDYIG